MLPVPPVQSKMVQYYFGENGNDFLSCFQYYFHATEYISMFIVCLLHSVQCTYCIQWDENSIESTKESHSRFPLNNIETISDNIKPFGLYLKLGHQQIIGYIHSHI